MGLAQTAGRKQGWGVRQRPRWIRLLHRPHHPVEGKAGATRRCTATGRGNPQQFPRGVAECKKTRGGQRAPRDVKNEGTSGDVHENKGQATICPTQKTPFLAGCMPFYTEMQVFCGNPRHFCRYSSPGKMNPLLQDVETRGSDVRARDLWPPRHQSPALSYKGCFPTPPLQARTYGYKLDRLFEGGDVCHLGT